LRYILSHDAIARGRRDASELCVHDITRATLFTVRQHAAGRQRHPIATVVHPASIVTI
jgi:hypothetical protein